VPDEGVASTSHDVEKVQRFPTYRPTMPQDPRRGRHVLRAALERLQLEDLVWSDSDSSEEDDVDFFLDPEGGPSEPPTQSSVPSPPPPVSEAQVTQPSELTCLLQQLIQQQREDRLAAEEAHKASEARFAQLQQEAARDRVVADERFAGLLDRVTQRQDAQIQQMQQGNVCYVWYGSASYHSHRVSAPALALTPTLTPATAIVSMPGIVPSLAGISYSALFSPLPQVLLFQSSARPTLPSEAAVSQQRQQPSAQPSV
jgi:hypothetical protein